MRVITLGQGPDAENIPPTLGFELATIQSLHPNALSNTPGLMLPGLMDLSF